MEGCRSIAARFPERELEIHRAHVRDASFRSACAEHEKATAALSRFREQGDKRVREYEGILAELESEIFEMLDVLGSRPGHT